MVLTRKMNKNELEELQYDVAMAMLKQMSHGSVMQFASDRMIQTLQNYDEEQLKSLLKQYTKGDKKKKKSSGGF